jgi:hypothetical protein
MSKQKSPERRHKLRVAALPDPKTEACSKAAVILARTHESADALLKAFELAQQERGTPRGMSTDDEQDLLRAMLVMTAAGLDSMLKQLIRDAMPALVRASPSVREGVEKFVTRSIRGDADSPEPLSAAKFLGRILAAESQQTQVIEEYIRDLTGTSLQSAPELAKTAAALGLSRTKVDVTRFKEIFDIRNKIIHELDINLSSDRRKRNLRGRESMMKHTNALLEIGDSVLQEIDEHLARKVTATRGTQLTAASRIGPRSAPSHARPRGSGAASPSAT